MDHLVLEYDRKAYGRSFGRYNGRKLRPQWKGKNFLFRSFGRKVTFSWKCPLAAERSSYGRNYDLAVLLKEHFFSWKSCLTAVRAPFGRKNPYGRILRLRCKWDFFNLPYYGCGERPKTPFGRTLLFIWHLLRVLNVSASWASKKSSLPTTNLTHSSMSWVRFLPL